MHVSTEAGARIIAKARYDGRKVFGETCPQYMFLNAEQMDLPDMHGAKLCCSPPLRDRASQEEIWRSLQNGTFQVYSSDHAPYRYDDTGKLHAGPNPDFPQIANGLPGIEMRLPLLFSEGFVKGRITLNLSLIHISEPTRRYAISYGVYSMLSCISAALTTRVTSGSQIAMSASLPSVIEPLQWSKP